MGRFLYPVFHFIMSGLKNLMMSNARSKLEAFLRDYAVKWSADGPLTE